MYEQFAHEMPEETNEDLCWKWLVQSDLKVPTEATCCTRTTIRANHTKNKFDKTSENLLCRMCGERGETVQHIIYECKKLAQHECK